MVVTLAFCVCDDCMHAHAHARSCFGSSGAEEDVKEVSVAVALKGNDKGGGSRPDAQSGRTLAVTKTQRPVWHTRLPALRVHKEDAVLRLQMRQSVSSTGPDGTVRSKSYMVASSAAGDSLLGQIYIPLMALARGAANGQEQLLTVPLYSHTGTFKGAAAASGGGGEAEAEETAGR